MIETVSLPGKTTMIPIKRQQTIINHLLTVKVASIIELAEMLDVSSMTIRRDVQKLELAGRVVSVSGGVTISTELMKEPSHLDKRDMQRDEKEAIAREAEKLVERGATVYLDAGTTTLAFARRLAKHRAGDSDLLVVTNDLVITTYLIENSSLRLYHIGGLVVRENRSCAGDGAAKALKALNIDVAFISTPSWNTRWLSTPDSEKSPVKKAAVSSSVKRVLLTDSSKYGKLGAFKAVPTTSLNLIITDDNLAEGAREALREQGVELIIAEVPGKKRRGKRGS
ncbi:MAG: DeoR/GlpR family DNA-binding transcription regulator [Planctomycetaceae bacterium]|nr:DeoR/GlpR family DNA-binding transcription regulator [Planctomycetaceae bacterium]